MGELAGCDRHVSVLNLVDWHLKAKHLGNPAEREVLDIELVPVSNAPGAKIGAAKQCFSQFPEGYNEDSPCEASRDGCGRGRGGWPAGRCGGR